MVKSVSWPTAEITGTGHAAIARATTSSLKAQRSSIDPPPRPTITTSTPGTRAMRGEPPRHVGRGPLALHARRPDDEVRVRIAGAQHGHDVAHGRAIERRDDPDLARQEGQRALARRREQALGLEPPLQLLEGDLQGACARRLEPVADDLVLALDVVDADAAARDDALAVFDPELQAAAPPNGT